MIYQRKRGLNFLQTKYKLVDRFVFVPHIRSNGRASLPYSIIDYFGNKVCGVALLKIYSSGKIPTFRIKKLYHEGGSYTISLKNEKNLKGIKIEILNIKSESELLERDRSDILGLIPKFTSKSTPIYIFDCNFFYFVGGYYKKDFFIKKDLLKDRLLYSFLGLYLADGGKTAATFTNSWPGAVNHVLDFIETNCSITRKDIRASICCNPSLKSKKKELEQFWSDKAGISKFFSSLHINKNVKSPQGILELYFNSEILKGLFLNLISKLDFFNNLDFINGFLSGDGSPILQNKYYITHHIVFDPKRSLLSKTQYANLFENYKINFINRNRLVVYTNWDQNLYWLVNGVYSLNPLKRLRYIKYFLGLPKTKVSNLYEETLAKEYKASRKNLIVFYNSLVDYGVHDKEAMRRFILKELR